ncbi:MAG: DUF4230 domain-containing protein, partial [Saprospiraceae bacterium]|nr:DUF4230 domain-containing protein [Saprospiraceae bacterium]
MQQRNTRNGGGLHNMGRAMLIMTIVGIAALIIFNFARGGFQKSSIGDLITGANVPKGLQIAYVPVEFKPDIDEENALAVLSNPERYRREFDQLIYDFNLQLLQHVGRRMDLPDSLYTRLEVEYKKHHQYLKDLYFNDFIVLRDTTAGNYEQWYNNESGGAVEALKEVSSKYVCFFVNQIILTLVGAEGGKLSVKGKDVETPCAIALNEALQPLTKRLQERAAIDDFAKSKGLLQEKVESVISELATMEVRDKKGLSKALSTKVLGFDVSSTNVEISAMSILKVGFKLDNYFDIELSKGNKEVVVTLPEPTI